MAKIGRLAGAILVHTEDKYVLVGNTKEPCDFPAHGFERPVEIDALKTPALPLQVCGEVAPVEPLVTTQLEGDALTALLAKRMLIERNASVSDRLWRLVALQDDQGRFPEGPIPADWLLTMPQKVWDIVRDTVLRC